MTSVSVVLMTTTYTYSLEIFGLFVLFVADTKETGKKVEAYKQCLEQLPDVNHATLKQLVLHLSRSSSFFK